MLSTLRLRYACCSVLPSGRTQRSSWRRYSSTIIQFISAMRMNVILFHPKTLLQAFGPILEDFLHVGPHEKSVREQIEGHCITNAIAHEGTPSRSSKRCS